MKRIETLDSLRGISEVAVVADHLWMASGNRGDIAHWAVVLFFCAVRGLSGLAADPVYPLVEVPSVWLGRSLTSRWPHQNETYLERPTE